MEGSELAPEGEPIAPTDNRDAWVPLGPYTWLTPALALSLSSGLVVLLAVNFSFQVFRGLVEDDSRRTGIAFDVIAFCVALLVALGAVTLIQHLRYPRPFADFGSSMLKVGRRTIPFGAITWARFEIVVFRGRRRRLTIMFGAPAGPRVVFDVSSKGRWAMSADTRELLAEVISRSQIELPVSSYDPSGRFARYNFPSSLDKQSALKAVTDPNEIIDELPIA